MEQNKNKIIFLFFPDDGTTGRQGVPDPPSPCTLKTMDRPGFAAFGRQVPPTFPARFARRNA